MMPLLDRLRARAAACGARGPAAPHGMRAAAMAGGVLLAVLALPAADASVVIGSTRVVLEAGAEQATLRFENRSDYPSLMQLWIDAGDKEQKAEDAEVPFIITPPVFRIEPGQQRVARLAHTGEPLPGDRESLYWINALEVPPSLDKEQSPNHLQIAFRSRLKLLHRPQGLRPEAREAAKALVWRHLPGSDGATLHVQNPTPYYLSFGSVELVTRAGSTHAMLTDDPSGHMVTPFSDLRLKLPPRPGRVPADAMVRAAVLDDHGALLAVEAALTPPGSGQTSGYPAIGPRP